ncbi:MAG: helix-turn-helix domain-containing protein, partial [Gammaproteobacteria bacterium]
MSEETPPETNTSPEEAPRSAGERLRAAREAQGLRVETAAEALGFARDIVIALEVDDYARLGAPVYARGYLRKYAGYLGLPGDDLVARYERGATPREPALTAHLSPIVAPRRSHAGHWIAGVVAAIVIAILVIAGLWGWHYVRQTRKNTRIPPAAAASSAPIFAQSLVRRGYANLAPATTRALARAEASAPGDWSASAASVVPAPAAPAPRHPQLALQVTAVSW